MNTGKKITELREAAAVQGESRYPVSMGDGTGVKQVKHSTLVEQLKTDMGMTYEETLAMLRATDAEGNKKIPNLKAVSDWIASKITNNMMATEAGFFLDARLGPVIDNRFTAVENAVTQINSELAKKIIVNVRLKEIGWHSSTDGMFFSDPLNIDIQMQEILNVCLGSWGGISKETNIFPFISSNGINIGIMSNTNEFLDRSFCEVYILYR